VRVVPGGLNRVTASLEEDDQPNESTFARSHRSE
jgi:hypothetical protein